jgi:hypothetical protein
MMLSDSAVGGGLTFASTAFLALVGASADALVALDSLFNIERSSIKYVRADA